jgi:hypothetical protein
MATLAFLGAAKFMLFRLVYFQFPFDIILFSSQMIKRHYLPLADREAQPRSGQTGPSA